MMNFSMILSLAFIPVLIFDQPSIAQSLPTVNVKLDHEADKKAQTQIYLSQGHSLFDQGLYDQSMAIANKAIDLSPNNALAWQLLGNCLKKMGRNQEALAAYDQAVKLLAEPAVATVTTAPNVSPQTVITTNSTNDIAQLWVERARTLDRLNRFQESIAAYDQALKIRCQEQLLQSPNNLPSVCDSYLSKYPNPNANSPSTLDPKNNQPQNTVVIPVTPSQQPKTKPNPTIW